MTNSHRTCSHAPTPAARAACRRERANAADALRAEYASIIGRRVLFGFDDEPCDTCPDVDEYHARHYAIVRDVVAHPNFASPDLLVWDEASMKERNIHISIVEFVKE
jgi:hypothetical protein